MLCPNGSAPRKETESDDLLATGSDAPQHLDNNTLAQILTACVLCLSFATLPVFLDQKLHI
jgi:hypothetical protein